MANIEQLRAKLQRDAKEIERAIREAFPATPLPKDVPIGFLAWKETEKGQIEYGYSAYEPEELVEAFFRGLDQKMVEENFYTDQLYKWSYMKQFMPKTWTELERKLLIHLNPNFTSPQGLAYYIPAYMITYLWCLVDQVWSRASSAKHHDPVCNRLYEIDFILAPPPELWGVDVWEALEKLPPKALDPKNLEMAGISDQERFLRFLGQFTPAQKRATQRFAQFLYRFEKGTFYEDNGEKAFVACWLRPKFE